MKHLLLVGLVACASEAAPKIETIPNDNRSAPKPAAKPNTEVDPRFAAMIVKAAQPYQKWGRIDEHPNVAPMMCDSPRPRDYGSQGRVHMSESADAPHGKKLYYLWASNRDAYRNVVTDQPIQDGFAIVKESFAAKPIGSARTDVQFDGNPPLHDKLRVDGAWLTIGEPKGLFVMTKVGGDGTDAGWIYGTIAPGGEVTSAGRVASCIGCHEDAPHGRLFGPKQNETHGY